jgi:hypothetical protein
LLCGCLKYGKEKKHKKYYFFHWNEFSGKKGLSV